MAFPGIELANVRDAMKILLFGASGTAGGAVLQACLDTPVVAEVRVVVRRPLGRTDLKLREFVHANYLDYTAVTEAFRAVDACLFCLGTSVTQVSKEEFVRISHDYAAAAAKMLKKESPDAPGCQDCHGSHGILGKKDSASPTFSRNVPALCGKCHRTGQKAALRYNGTQHDVVEHYLESIHGKGLMQSGLTVTADCADCH